MRRAILAAASGVALGAAYALAHLLAADAVAVGGAAAAPWVGRFLATAVWPAFTFAILTTLGALVAEVLLPEVETTPLTARPSGGTERVPVQPT